MKFLGNENINLIPAVLRLEGYKMFSNKRARHRLLVELQQKSNQLNKYSSFTD